MNQKLIKTVLFLILVISISVSVYSETINFATGPTTGVYHLFGQKFKEIIERDNNDITVNLINTNGTPENIELLNSSKVQLGFSQNDRYLKEQTNLKTFLMPYTEYIIILTNSLRKVNNLDQLKGFHLKIFAGDKKSGTRYMAEYLMNTASLDYEILDIGLNRAKEMLIHNELDLFIMVCGYPNPQLMSLIGKVVFVSISTEIIKRLRESSPGLLFSRIPRDNFVNKHSDFSTVGMNSLIISNGSLDDDAALAILKSLYKYEDEFNEFYPIKLNLFNKDISDYSPLPVHDVTLNFFNDIKWNLYLSDLIIILGILIAIILYTIFRHQINFLMMRNLYIKLALIFILFYIGGTIGVYIFEHSINSNFATIAESLWSSTVYLLSGFEDRTPVTLGGRIMSLLIFVASIFVIGSVAGNFASLFIRQKEVRMSHLENEHIVICNWNDRIISIIKELHSEEGVPDTPILVLTNEKPENENEIRKIYNKEFHNIDIRNSDPTFHSSLEHANIQRAQTILILADDKSSDPDAKSALIALGIQSVCREFDKKPYVIAESLNHRKIEHLKDAGVDEIICSTDFGVGIMAQTVIYPGLSNAYHHMLEYSDDTNEIYVIENEYLPEKEGKCILEGMTFDQIARFIKRNGDQNSPIVPMGYRRGKEIIINPRKDKEVFMEGDDLIVLTYFLPKERKRKKKIRSYFHVEDFDNQ